MNREEKSKVVEYLSEEFKNHKLSSLLIIKG